jgi:hypothetical protein
MGTTAFEIRNTPDKGRGLFALRSIPKGDTILIEKVLALSMNGGMEGNVWMSPEFWAGLKQDEETAGLEGHGEIGRLVRQYIEEAAAQGFNVIKELRGAHPEFQDRLVDIFFTNRLRLRSDFSYIGLGKHSSIINHACISNAHLSSDTEDWENFRVNACVKATKDIAVGEEITIGYLELNCEQEWRQRYTHAYFKFICSCDTCEALDSIREVTISALGRAYETIDGSTDISLGVAEPWTFFRNAANIWHLLREVDVSDRRIAEFWLECAFIAAQHSDAIRTRCCFRNAAAWYRIAKPSDCVELKELDLWIDAPAQHRRWGKTNLGASDLSYDPILEDDALSRETLRLLFMTDYETPEYRRIALGADRDLSTGARAQIARLGLYYMRKMETDTRNIEARVEADARKVALEAEEQRARAAGDALIAQVEREEQEKATQVAEIASKASKKAKKRQRKKNKEDTTAAVVTDQHVQTNAESKLDIGQQSNMRLLKLEANSTHVEAASNSADVGWELVMSKKGKTGMDRGIQGAATANQGTAEERRVASGNQDKSNTRRPEAFSYSPPKHSPVKGGESQSTVHADARENDEGNDRVEGLRPLETDSKDEQESNTISAGASTLRGGLEIVIASEAITEDAAEASGGRHRPEKHPAFLALLEANQNPIVGRPRAASSPLQIPVFELELGVPGLQEKIRVRQAEILDFQERMNSMEDRLEEAAG